MAEWRVERFGKTDQWAVYTGGVSSERNELYLGLKPIAMRLYRTLNTLTQERDELKAALEFYADRQIYFHDDGKCSLACADEGDKARAAILKTEEG